MEIKASKILFCTDFFFFFNLKELFKIIKLLNEAFN